MSVPASQLSAARSATEPAPVVSDIPATQLAPAPAVSPATVNGIGHRPDTGIAQTIPGSAVPSGSAPPSNGPAPSAPSQPAPAAKSVLYTLPAPHSGNLGHTVTIRLPVQPTHQSPPAPAPLLAPRLVSANSYQTHSNEYPYAPSQPAQGSYQRQPLQPVHQQSYQPQSSRPLIVEPPRKRSSLGLAVAMPQANPASSGFPSPTKDYPSTFPKFSDDLSRNSLAIKQSVPEAVRQAVRDNWEKCLLGSEFHQAFVLNASMHHSTPGVQNRAIHDFGGNLVANCKSELIGHFSARDIDDVADLILAKASNAFLDKALEMRLATIDAKPLLNALARAERLGYDAQDLVEVSQGERVIPNNNIGDGLPDTAIRSNGSRAALPSELQCLRCYRTFTKKSYFDYHLSRSVCSKVPPTADGFRYACTKCGQGFTHPGGLTYHTQHTVCDRFTKVGDDSQHSDLPATPIPVRSTASPSNPNMAHTPSSQLSRSSTATVLPANRHGEVAAAKASPGGDPYSHLSEEQLEALNAELLQAEKQYAGRFAEAEALVDPEQRRNKLESLRNTFGTKQSMIRKRYGVRLRERRTRAEIQAERERMGRAALEPEHGTQSPIPQQQPTTTPASAWTAANRVVPTAMADESNPTHKRRRVDEDSGYDASYPQQQIGLTTRVSEMAGGLGASVATAATHDPTLPPASTPSRTYQQAGARVEIHIPSKSSPTKPLSAAPSASGRLNGSASRDDSQTPDGMEVDHDPSPSAQLRGQHRDIGARDIKADVDGDDVGPESDIIHIEDDSDDDDDEDIPASLPPSVRQSLASSQVRSNP